MTRAVSVSIRQLPHGRDLPLPSYETELAAGMDLRAALAEDQPVMLECRSRTMIPTGISIALPDGYEAQIRPRSGLAARHGVTLLNAPGTIDADYRGEIKVILINHGDEPLKIARGDRVAQMIVAPVTRVEWCVEDQLSKTERGTGGFGSTGIASRKTM